MIFESFDSFRELLENDELMQDFYEETAHFRGKQSQDFFRINSAHEDYSVEFLDQLLDQNKMVSIGDYTFRIDMSNKAVYVVSKGSVLEEALVQEEYQKKGIMKFSTDNDVLDLLEEGYTSSPQIANSAILCGGGCDSFDLSTPSTFFSPSPNNYSTRVRYVKAGIYFELSYHFYMNWAIGPVTINQSNSPTSTHQAIYRGNCRRSDLVTRSDNGVPTLMSFESIGTNLNPFGPSSINFKRSLWRRSEGLRIISLTVNFQVAGLSINANSQSISCNIVSI